MAWVSEQMTVPSPPEDWYQPLASHLKDAYLRYSFTKHTSAEVDFLFDALDLSPGKRLLDVGCGPGRHALEMASRGVEVVGIDISRDFLDVARAAAIERGVSVSLFEMDARSMPFDEEFDAVMSICEGAFSLGLDDLGILKQMAGALLPAGRLAANGVNVFYVLKHMSDSGEFDPGRMLFRETVVDVIGGDGSKKTFDMWNSCYTPRELEWLANGAGLDPLAVYGVSPGAYGLVEATVDHPELLLIATKGKDHLPK